MLTPKKIFYFCIFIAIIGMLSLNIYEIGLCTTGFCRDFIEDVMGLFLFCYGVIMVFFSSILIFLKKEIFTSWWKFARVYIPISAILTILSGEGRGGGYISLTSDYESTAWFTAGLFFIISLALIIYKFLKFRGKYNQ